MPLIPKNVIMCFIRRTVKRIITWNTWCSILIGSTFKLFTERIYLWHKLLRQQLKNTYSILWVYRSHVILPEYVLLHNDNSLLSNICLYFITKIMVYIWFFDIQFLDSDQTWNVHLPKSRVKGSLWGSFSIMYRIRCRYSNNIVPWRVLNNMENYANYIWIFLKYMVILYYN